MLNFSYLQVHCICRKEIKYKMWIATELNFTCTRGVNSTQLSLDSAVGARSSAIYSPSPQKTLQRQQQQLEVSTVSPNRGGGAEVCEFLVSSLLL